jgi:hypothetical protein
MNVAMNAAESRPMTAAMAAMAAMAALREPLAWMALALLGSAAWLWFDAGQMRESATALQEQTLLLAQRGETLRANLDRLQRSDGTATALTAAQRFHGSFPEAGTRDRRLAAILSRARKSGLMLGPTDYRQRVEPGLQLVRYSMTLPLTGSYAAIRSLIDDCLRADPALGLTSLRLRRKDLQSAQVQAQIEFALYMRAAQAASGE